MGKHNVFRNGKAKAGPSRFAGTSLVDTVETFEEAGQGFRGDAGAKILPIEFHATPGGPRAPDHAAFGATVLHSIIYHAREDLVGSFTNIPDYMPSFPLGP